MRGDKYILEVPPHYQKVVRHNMKTFLSQDGLRSLVEFKYHLTQHEKNQRRVMFNMKVEGEAIDKVCLRIRTSYCFNKKAGIYCFDEGLKLAINQEKGYSGVGSGIRIIRIWKKRVDDKIKQHGYFSIRVLYEELFKVIDQLFMIQEMQSVYLDCRLFMNREDDRVVVKDKSDPHHGWCDELKSGKVLTRQGFIINRLKRKEPEEEDEVSNKRRRTSS